MVGEADKVKLALRAADLAQLSAYRYHTKMAEIAESGDLAGAGQQVATRVWKQEKRLTMYPMGFWRDMCGDRPMPHMDDFNPDTLEDWRANCFSLWPDETGKDGEFQEIGQRIANVSNVTAEHRKVSQVPEQTLLRVATDAMSVVIEDARPALDEGDFVDWQGRTCLYRGILLPLSDGEGRVSLILGGADCKIIEASD